MSFEPSSAASLTSPSAGETRPPRAGHAKAAAAHHGGGRSVLVVDTSSIARTFLVQRLGALGYSAHGASSGEEALQMIEREPFSIVFVELTLAPNGLDGLALCQAIKQSQAGLASGREPPAVVVTTGQSGAADRVRSTLAGCDAYLNKPLNEASFASTLEKIDPLF